MDHRTHIVAMGLGLEIAMARASTATAQTTSAHLLATDGKCRIAGHGHRLGGSGERHPSVSGAVVREAMCQITPCDLPQALLAGTIERENVCLW